MRQWTRAKVQESCGGCGAAIYPDQPMQTITIEGVKRKRPMLRCTDCAGPAPPDLPQNIRQTPIPERMAAIQQAGAGMPRTRKAATSWANSVSGAKLPDADWTARILGERE